MFGLQGGVLELVELLVVGWVNSGHWRSWTGRATGRRSVLQKGWNGVRVGLGLKNRLRAGDTAPSTGFGRGNGEAGVNKILHSRTT